MHMQTSQKKTLFTSSDVQLGGIRNTNKTDETLMFNANKYVFYIKFVTEIVGHD